MATRPRARHRGDLRERLLSGVASVLRDKGIGALSMREVARRAGVSHNAPLHHYGTKAGLLTAFATAGYARLGQMIQATIRARRPRSGPELLEAIGGAYVRFALENRDQFTMMFRPELFERQKRALVRGREGVHGDLEQERGGVYAFLRTAVGRCVEERYLEPGDLEVATATAWSVAHGFVDLWFSGRFVERLGRRDSRRLYQEVLQFFVAKLTGVGPRPRRRARRSTSRPSK
jgi:AcrR family transcriptional regulator